MAKAKSDQNGKPLPTTPYVSLGGRTIAVEDLTPSQLETWQAIKEAEDLPDAWQQKGVVRPGS